MNDTTCASYAAAVCTLVLAILSDYNLFVQKRARK